MRDLGADVAFCAYWGLRGGIIDWEGFPVYPGAYAQWGDDVVDSHARHFHADLILTLQDVWPLMPDIGNRGFPWVALVPVDSTPVAQKNLDVLRSAFQVAAISRWGQNELKVAGVDAVYLPHGYDPGVYHPEPGDRRELKAWLGFPEDAFLAGMVAANKGWPSRKAFEEVFDAFGQFAALHADAHLYLHTHVGSQVGGPNLVEMAGAFGFADRVKYVNPYLLTVGTPADEMRRIYSAFDVLLAPSLAEGFGVPTIEAEACGTPVIVTDFSAQTELCGAGWTVKPARKRWMPLNNFMAEPSIPGIVEALEAAYVSGPALREQATMFAQRYAQPRLQERYWAPWLADVEKRVLGPAAGARSHPGGVAVSGNGHRRALAGEWDPPGRPLVKV